MHDDRTTEAPMNPKIAPEARPVPRKALSRREPGASSSVCVAPLRTPASFAYILAFVRQPSGCRA